MAWCLNAALLSLLQEDFETFAYYLTQIKRRNEGETELTICLQGLQDSIEKQPSSSPVHTSPHPQPTLEATPEKKEKMNSTSNAPVVQQQPPPPPPPPPVNEGARRLPGRLDETILRETSQLILGKSPPSTNCLHRQQAVEEEEGDVVAALSVARALFQEADLDENGSLSVAELGTLLGGLAGYGGGYGGGGVPATAAAVESLLGVFDGDGSGTIDLYEFMMMLCEEPFVELLPTG